MLSFSVSAAARSTITLPFMKPGIVLAFCSAFRSPAAPLSIATAILARPGPTILAAPRWRDRRRSLRRADAADGPAIGDSSADIAIELNWAINETIALLAGRAAERLFFGELPPATSHDEVEARAIATLICRSPESVDAFIAFAEIEATTLTAGRVEVVLAVANELIARRTLTGVEIDAIMRGTVWRGRWDAFGSPGDLVRSPGLTHGRPSRGLSVQERGRGARHRRR
jgi:hypothetical protein